MSDEDGLKNAFTIANESDGTTTVTLTKDVTIDSNMKGGPGDYRLFALDSQKNMVLDLNNNELIINFTNSSAFSSVYVIDASGDSTLTIKNGKFSVNALSSQKAPVYAISSTGIVNVENCEITV